MKHFLSQILNDLSPLINSANLFNQVIDFFGTKKYDLS